MLDSRLIVNSFLLFAFVTGLGPVLSKLTWDTQQIHLPDTLGSQTILITSNATEFEVTSTFACPNNYRCNLQVVIESMTCVRNISSSAPDYIKFYLYENPDDETATNVVDECGELDSSTLHENSIIGRGLNTSKVLIRPVGERWTVFDFKASVYVRVNLEPVEDAKEIKINRILPNFELNFVDDIQYTLTMGDFTNDELFPSPNWTRSVRVSVQDMKCDRTLVEQLQVDAINAIGMPARSATWCQNVDSDQVTIAVLSPGDKLTLSSTGDWWKKGLTSALVVFTTQMSSEVAECPSTYFNCLRHSCQNSGPTRSVCIPLDLTCNRRFNCLDTCKIDESADICSSKPTCTGNDYSDQLKIEVNKIGTWFVGLILVLLMLICLIAFHVGLTAGQFQTLKVTITTKLNEIRNRSLIELPLYHQIMHEKQPQQ